LAEVIAHGVATANSRPRRAAGGNVFLQRDDPVLSSADDRAMRRQAGASIDQMIDFVLAGARAEG